MALGAEPWSPGWGAATFARSDSGWDESRALGRSGCARSGAGSEHSAVTPWRSQEGVAATGIGR